MIVVKHSTVVVNFRASGDLQCMYYKKHRSSFSLVYLDTKRVLINNNFRLWVVGS